MNIKQLYKGILLFAMILPVVACDPWKDDVEPNDGNVNKSLNEIVRENADISTFAGILQQTGYDQFLNEKQALTVFAPTNSALSGLDMNNTEALKEWIQNYIALLSYYTDMNGNFQVEAIEMVNGKSIPVNASAISGSNIIKTNLLSANGVLHIIDNVIADRKSIWEYMQEQTGYAQVRFIQSREQEVMDMDRSTPTGVNAAGQQTYDTVWVKTNPFLEAYPLNDERSTFTVILLNDAALNALSPKYLKYFSKKEAEEATNEAMYQISSDMILQNQTITASGKYLSVDGILVDLNPSDIVESYQASNGMVYKLSAADVKMYNNKIKEQIIEAEDYIFRYDGSTTDPLTDAWLVRYRSWASGGQDVVLKGATYNYVDYEHYDETGDSIISGTNSYRFTYPSRTENPICKQSNAYLLFKPTLHSVDYNIYWVAYDDVESHYTDFGTDTIKQPMMLEQKLLISFPGEQELSRGSTGIITGNFSPYSVMAGTSTAGIHEETKLTRYRANVANDGIFLLDQPYTSEDAFGAGEILKSPGYGEATFFFANTVRGTYTISGLLFLDYIRLVPLVDPND